MGRDGGMLQRGTHDQLIAEPGMYREFYEARCRAESWSL